ncbi:PAS domain-containing protein [Rhizobium sp. LjRoot98]|uniref:PAS domain-containing protein n=1 Tax=Rhizobium sp. LjRoot98 TaxID=3342345 RepID=UPI0009E87F80
MPIMKTARGRTARRMRKFGLHARHNYYTDFRYLFDNAPCGYLVLDARGRIVLVNATLRNRLGREDHELQGKRLLHLLTVAGRVFYETHFAPWLRMQGCFN